MVHSHLLVIFSPSLLTCQFRNCFEK